MPRMAVTGNSAGPSRGPVHLVAGREPGASPAPPIFGDVFDPVRPSKVMLAAGPGKATGLNLIKAAAAGGSGMVQGPPSIGGPLIATPPAPVSSPGSGSGQLEPATGPSGPARPSTSNTAGPGSGQQAATSSGAAAVAAAARMKLPILFVHYSDDSKTGRLQVGGIHSRCVYHFGCMCRA